MELMLVEDKASLKKDCRISRARNQKAMSFNLLEAIAQVPGGGVVSCNEKDGVVQMKIVVRKQDLKHMVAMMGGGKNGSHLAPSSSLEQRKYVARRHLRRGDHVKGLGRRHSPWKPVLQSIPEEL
ncbi:hypothetical protein HHK36_008757 [Tetracentron sinense]|uniref:Uncharacterized protein n=1 Tax=Tetracentron sinense TaxID=13715 RepID=A0A835DNH9_TETSI|nr:hypothetical protein HHK36_008757 [Tetracentron sinense]